MGVEVLLDDRDERIGVKFNDLELIGIFMRIIVGKNINEGKVEFKFRYKEDKEIIDIEEINEKVKVEFIRNNVRLG